MRKRKSIDQFTLSMVLAAPCRQNGLDQPADRDVCGRQNARVRLEAIRLRGRAWALNPLQPFTLGRFQREHDSI